MAVALALPVRTPFDYSYGRVKITKVEAHQCPHCSDHVSPTLPEIDEFVPGSDCRCLDCMAQFWPAELWTNDEALKQAAISDETAQHLALTLVDQVQADRAYIEGRLRSYGNSLLSKWRKMPEHKRSSILTAAESDLYAQNWPEKRIRYGIDPPEHPTQTPTEGIYQNNGNRSAWFSRRQRLALLLPYLTVETLASDPMKLFGLLHHRTNSPPEDWVAFDVDQMKFGWNFGCLMDTYNGNCVIMHGEQFGKLVPWQEETRHTWMAVGFPRAKLVLEAQSELFRILRRIIDELVQPGRNQEGNDKWIAMTADGFKGPGQAVNWSTFSNQPFSAPPQFDVYECLEQVKAQLAAFQDHLYFLQTEPLYLRYEIEQKWRMMPQGTNFEFAMDQVVEQAIVIPLRDVQRLTAMLGQCERIKEIYEQHKVLIQASLLPPEYQIALSGLEYLCYREYEQDAHRVKWQMAMSSGFGAHWRPRTPKEIETDGTDGWVPIDRARSWKEDYRHKAVEYLQDPLLWAMMALLAKPSDPTATSRSRVMAEVEERLSQPQGASRITEGMYHRLAKIETELVIMGAIRQYRPSIEYFNAANMLTPAEEEKYGGRFSGTIMAAMTCCESRDIKELFGMFFQMHWPKGKRDQGWLSNVASIHDQQMRIWDCAQQALTRQLTDIGMSPDKIDAEVQLFFGDLHQEHREIVEAQAAEIAEKAARRKVQGIIAPSAPAQTQWGKYEQPKVALPVCRIKPKTKGGEIEPLGENSTSNADATAQEVERATIAVRRDSMQVFQKMLSSRLVDDDRGVIAWDKFVAAMTDAGFSATHTGGSEVTFKPVTEITGAKGRIVFHKPHPTSQIGSIMLSSMGRRLRKWFDWDIETFVERKKGSA